MNKTNASRPLAERAAAVAPEVSGLQSPSTALWRYLALMGLAGLPLVFLAKDPYWLNIIAFTYLMGGLAAAWNIIGGFGGQFSLGHGAIVMLIALGVGLGLGCGALAL